jgi:hypothetical protein
MRRRHRHRFVAEEPVGLIQIIFCRLRGCDFLYEQGMLFDPRDYR